MIKTKGNKNRGQSSERGQSLVELAASLVVLLLLLSGVLDIGRAFFTFVTIENAAGEGALFAAYHPTWVTYDDAVGGGASSPEYNNVTYRAAHESPTGVVDWSRAVVSVDAPVLSAGQPVTVTVSYSYTLLTPFIGNIVGSDSLPLNATAAQMILSVDAP